MVSSAAVGDQAASPETTKAAATSTPKEATTEPKTTQKVDPSATTQKVDPSATTTQQENGAGCPKITYGMLFSFISAILLLSA